MNKAGQNNTNNPEIQKKKIPVFTLAEDKVFLAVAPIQVVDKLCYVYSLVCPKNENGTFNLEPHVELSVLRTPEDATIYYGATTQMLRYHNTVFKQVFGMFKERIDKFYQDTQQKTK